VIKMTTNEEITQEIGARQNMAMKYIDDGMFYAAIYETRTCIELVTELMKQDDKE